jgi:RHS repeat-associated protein
MSFLFRIFARLILSITVIALVCALQTRSAHAGGGGLTAGKGCPPAGNPRCGDPITIGTGAVFSEVTDYETSGQNKLSLKRYYNSPVPGAFNFFASFNNWRSNYDSFIDIRNINTSVDVVLPDNKSFFFVPDGSGGWRGPPNLSVKLTQSGSIFTFADWDDTVYTYSLQSNANGFLVNLLTSIKNRNGYTRTLQYTTCGGNCYSQIASVTDSYGRKLTFTPGPLPDCGGVNACIGSVTTPDGLVISYGYPQSPTFFLQTVTYSTNPATTITYQYDSNANSRSGSLTQIIDQNGNPLTTWTYDDNQLHATYGYALSTQHAGGADATTVAYNSDGSRTVTNPLGEQEIYRFTQFNTTTSGMIPVCTEIDRQASATTAAATRLFTYDSNGYLASETDWNGNLTTYVNDARGEPTTITEAAGAPQQRVTTTTYHPTFHLPSQVVGPRTTTNFAYDANGELLTRSETDNTARSVPYSTQGQTRSWAFTWANELLVSSKGPRASTAELTQYGYDASGALTSITDALGHTTQITQHLPGGLPQTIVDPNGVTTNLTYDARQRLLSSTLQGGTPLTTSYGYDAAGNLTKKTLPDGSALTLTYDAAHRLTGITDLDNRRIVYTLDALGNRTQTQIFGGAGQLRRTRSATFDALGRQLTEVGGAGQTTTYAYDNNGNVVSITDPLGRVTQQVFDPLNRKTQVTEPDGAGTTIGYNQLDEVNAVTDPLGHTTTYLEDGFGDVIEEISPDRGTTVYTYNIGGLLTQKVDAAGVVTNHSWDFLDRVATTTYPGNPAENVTYTYDQGPNGIGRLTGVTDAVGTLTRSYNLRGLVTRETRASGAATRSTGYTYDLANRLATITYPSGLVVTYSRDDMGRITAVNATNPATSLSIPVVSAIATFPFGPRNSLTYGDGAVEVRGYDLDYRLTNLASSWGSPLQNLSYAYDANDNVLSITDGVTPGNSQTFAYNNVNRLNQAAGGYGGLAYTYDLVGNRLTQTTTIGSASSTQTYGYDAASNRLLQTTLPGSTPPHQFAYSPTGNVVQDLRSGAPYTLSYNQANRLAGFANGGNTVGAYAYDAFGQRLTKTVSAGTTLYQYDLAGHLIEESDVTAGPATARADYVYLDDQPVGFYIPNSGMLFYHSDRLGTPQLVTDASKGVDWIGNYQPFGPVTISASITQNLRLPGQYFDAEIGWSHNGARTYAQGLGRYIESDPIGLGGGLNTYAYADGNPQKNLDPKGLQFFFPRPPQVPVSTVTPIHRKLDFSLDLDKIIDGLVDAANLSRRVAVDVLCVRFVKALGYGPNGIEYGAPAIGEKLNDKISEIVNEYQNPGSMTFPGGDPNDPSLNNQTYNRPSSGPDYGGTPYNPLYGGRGPN